MWQIWIAFVGTNTGHQSIQLIPAHRVVHRETKKSEDNRNNPTLMEIVSWTTHSLLAHPYCSVELIERQDYSMLLYYFKSVLIETRTTNVVR